MSKVCRLQGFSAKVRQSISYQAPIYKLITFYTIWPCSRKPVFSAIVLNISIPFTRDDLHQLYDYDKALYKATIEKNDNFPNDTKERKKGEIEFLFSEAEMLDMSLMTSDVYYPPANSPCLATILNTITVQAFLKRLKEIMEN